MKMIVVDDEKARRRRPSIRRDQPRIVRFEHPRLFEHEPAAKPSQQYPRLSGRGCELCLNAARKIRGDLARSARRG